MRYKNKNKKKAVHIPAHMLDYLTPTNNLPFLSVGFMMEALCNDQLSQIVITKINEYLQKNYNVDFIVYNNLLPIPPIQPLFSMMNMSEIYGHKGPLLALSIRHVPMFEQMPPRNNFYFYVVAKEWEAHNGPEYGEEFWAKIYKNPQVKLIVSHPELQRSLEEKFKAKIHKVVPDFNIPELVNLLRSESTYPEELLQPQLS